MRKKVEKMYASKVEQIRASLAIYPSKEEQKRQHNLQIYTKRI